MAILHLFQNLRVIATGILSLAALSIMMFQSVEIVQAFMSLFTDYFHKD
ncbi:hypothetical protein [Salibacterium aidingense]